jgi:hypothetical protein
LKWWLTWQYFIVCLLDAPTIFKEIGVNYIDKIVRPVTRTRIRDNAVFYDAVALYSTKGMSSRTDIQSIAADFKTRVWCLSHCWLETLIFRLLWKDNWVKLMPSKMLKNGFVLQKEANRT